jgi:hypothetical protein
VICPPLVFSPGSPLATAYVGFPYGQVVTVTGGTPGYTFSTTAGSLPTGLTLLGGQPGSYIVNAATLPVTGSTITNVNSNANGGTAKTLTMRLSVTNNGSGPVTGVRLAMGYMFGGFTFTSGATSSVFALNWGQCHPCFPCSSRQLRCHGAGVLQWCIHGCDWQHLRPLGLHAGGQH